MLTVLKPYANLHLQKLDKGCLGGGLIILKHISMVMQSLIVKFTYIKFLHDYLLACVISTVRTLALSY